MTTALWIAAACLLIEALFSGSEIAVVAADRLRIRHGAAAGRRADRLLLHLLASPQRLLATTLMGTQIGIVTATITMTIALSERYGEARAGLYTLLGLTPVLVIFGEIVPKSLGREHADRLAPRLCYVLWAAQRLLSPLVWLMAHFTTAAVRIAGLDEDHKLVTREELELVMKGKAARGSEITEGERRMISRIFDFGDRTAYDVMVPLSSLAALEDTASVDFASGEIQEKGYTRFPVYRERIDRIVGIVHSFSVLSAGLKGERDRTVSELMQPPSYVPENQPCLDVLVELQRSRKGIAVVVDEYGGAVGIVTVEDILEEIVGEIEDEYDVAPPPIRKEAEGSWRVRAQTTVLEVNRALKLELPEGPDYETVAGLMLDRLRHIPRIGESVRIGLVLLKVIEASERAVDEVQIRLGKKR